MIRFTMKNAERMEASFNLLIYRKPDAKASDPVHKRYIVFATNMPHSEALMVFSLLPDEYRKRWGIESGFRVQDNVQAKTTSTDRSEERRVGKEGRARWSTECGKKKKSEVR